MIHISLTWLPERYEAKTPEQIKIKSMNSNQLVADLEKMKLNEVGR